MFKRNELSVEAIMQLIIQTIMLLLRLPPSITKYRLQGLALLGQGWDFPVPADIFHRLESNSHYTVRPYIKTKSLEKSESLPVLSWFVFPMYALLVLTNAFLGSFLELI